MLKEVNWSNDRIYRTESNNKPIHFYLNSLCNSTRLDLLLGYFSSSAISLLNTGFATFLYNGGTIRMVINNILSKEDKETITIAKEGSLSDDLIDLTDIKKLAKSLDVYDKHFFECMAWLIAHGRIQIKIVRPKGRKGISHYKSGIFSDGSDKVRFKASCNFTAYGLTENLEELECFLSWEDTDSQRRLESQNEYFESIFSENSTFVEYLNADQIVIAVKEKFGNKKIEELLIQEKELLLKKRELIENKTTKVLFDRIINKIEAISTNPRFPYKEGPRPYQIDAFNNWKNNNQQGLFAMATGTGKTITALNCLLEIYKKTGYYKALILVPTITLVNQWENECKSFNFKYIVKVCSKSHWKDDFAAILTRERLSTTEQVSYIVISTYASFARKNIFNELNQLSPKTLLIADECHNMASGILLKLLPKINCKRKIGLSATPERQFDEEGNKKLFSFFDCKSGYTFEYAMEEAIKNKVLCRYYYYPHLVSLTESELKDYIDLSAKISKFYNTESDSFDRNSILTALLLARKRIIHKAFNKVSVFGDVLKGQYEKKGNLKYTLIYVPEGNDPNDYFETDYFSKKDEIENDNDAIHLIDVFTKKVKDIDKRTTVKQFTSGTNEREHILDQFAAGEIDALTSMKCLDEGIDVPRSELAIFCASTGNPRQFVQRRGRILRTHPQKQFAYIHDLVVIPEINPNSESYKMERSMLKKELERVKNFALLSENSSHTINTLLDTMNHYNLNLYHND